MMRQVPLKPNEIPGDKPAKANGRWYYPFTRIVAMSVSKDAAASLGYAGYVAGFSSAMSRCVLEISSAHPIVCTDAEGRDVAYGRWLVAGLATQDTTGTIGAAIANAQISKMKNQLAAELRGFSNKAVADAIHGLGGMQLDAATVKPFGEAIGGALQWCVDNAAVVDGTADPGGVFDLQTTDTDAIATACWALNSIAAGWSAEEAMAAPWIDFKAARRPPMTIDGLAVAGVYHRLGIAPAKKPTATQKAAASRILAGGASMPNRATATVGWVVDVPPYIRPDNSVSALRGLSADPKRISVGPWPPDGLAGPYAAILDQEITANVAIAGGAAGLVDASAKSQYRYWRYGYLSQYGRQGLPGTIILNERYAVGFQTFIRFLSMDASINAQIIAANASIHNMATSVEVQIIGADIGALDAASAVIPVAVSGFSVNTIGALGSLSACVSSALSSGKGFVPTLSAVELNLGSPEVQSLTDGAADYCTGLRAVASGLALAAAAPGGTPTPFVAAVYDALGVTAKPTASQQNSAKALLRTGA